MKKLCISIALLASTLSYGASLQERIEWIGQPQLSVIKVVTAKATRTNDLLRVQAEVLNEGSANQQLYYRFRWLDKEGFVVGGEEVWKPVIFYSNQKRILDTVAPTQDVEDFKIEMSTPK